MSLLFNSRSRRSRSRYPRSRSDRQPTLNDVEPYVEPEPVLETQPIEATPIAETPDPEPPAYEPSEAYMPSEEATVEGRMTGLLSGNSKYMQLARQKAKETANERGLLNSSMAATAGERAAIESALPIATSDAQAFNEAGMTGYRGNISGALATQKYGTDVGIIGKQKEASSELSAQEHTQALAVEQIQQEGANFRLKMETDSKDRLSKMDIGSGEKENAARLVADLGSTYTEQIRMVQADPNISVTSKTAVIADLRAQYEQNVQSVYAMYEVGITWVNSPVESAPPAVPPPKKKVKSYKPTSSPTPLNEPGGWT